MENVEATFFRFFVGRQCPASVAGLAFPRSPFVGRSENDKINTQQILECRTSSFRNFRNLELHCIPVKRKFNIGFLLYRGSHFFITGRNRKLCNTFGVKCSAIKNNKRKLKKKEVDASYVFSEFNGQQATQFYRKPSKSV